MLLCISLAAAFETVIDGDLSVIMNSSFGRDTMVISTAVTGNQGSSLLINSNFMSDEGKHNFTIGSDNLIIDPEIDSEKIFFNEKAIELENEYWITIRHQLEQGT